MMLQIKLRVTLTRFFKGILKQFCVILLICDISYNTTAWRKGELTPEL
jgi:hypothetical protein